MGDKRRCVSAVLYTDRDNSTFTVRIAPAGSLPAGFRLGNAEATVTIRDNDNGGGGSANRRTPDTAPADPANEGGGSTAGGCSISGERQVQVSFLSGALHLVLIGFFLPVRKRQFRTEQRWWLMHCVLSMYIYISRELKRVTRITKILSLQRDKYFTDSLLFLKLRVPGQAEETEGTVSFSQIKRVSDRFRYKRLSSFRRNRKRCSLCQKSAYGC